MVGSTIVLQLGDGATFFDEKWSVRRHVSMEDLAWHDFTTDLDWIYVHRPHDARIDALNAATGAVKKLLEGRNYGFGAMMRASGSRLAVTYPDYNDSAGGGYLVVIDTSAGKPIIGPVRLSSFGVRYFSSLIGFYGEIVSFYSPGNKPVSGIVDYDISTNTTTSYGDLPSYSYQESRWKSRVAYRVEERLYLRDTASNEERILEKNYKGDKLDLSGEILAYGYYDAVPEALSPRSPVFWILMTNVVGFIVGAAYLWRRRIRRSKLAKTETLFGLRTS